jgi:hypothetical protein
MHVSQAMKPGAFRKGRGSLRLHRETVRVLSSAELAAVDGGGVLRITTVATFNTNPKTNGWSGDLDGACNA